MALNNLGTVRPGSTLQIPFSTYTSDDPAKSVVVTELDVGAITVFKDGSLTQRTSTSGEGIDIDVDAIVGTHWITIDLSDNDHAGFYSAGSRYVVILQGLVIDAATAMSTAVATFDIGYPDAIINTTVASVTNQTQFILTNGPAEADALIGCTLLFHDVASAVQITYGYITDYAVTTKEVTCTDPVGFTFVATDNVSIFLPSNIHAVQGTTQTAGDIPALVVTADTAIDQAVTDIGNLNDVAATDIVSAGAITTSSGAVANVDLVATLTTYTNNTLQTADVAAAITDLDDIKGTSFIKDTHSLIDIKTETVLIVADTNELQGDDIPTLIAAVQSDTDNIQTRLPAALISGKMDSDATSISSSSNAAAGVQKFYSNASYTGAADSGTTTTMVDAARSEADGKHVGKILSFTSGTLIGESFLITAFDAASDTATFTPAATAGVTTEDYIISPGGRAGVVAWNDAAIAVPSVAGVPEVEVSAIQAGTITAAAIADAAIDNATFAADVGTTAYATNNIGLAANKAFDDALVETTGAPAITGTFRAAWEWMFALSRNKMLQTATTTTLRNDADGADLATSTVSDDATTYTRGEWST